MGSDQERFSRQAKMKVTEERRGLFKPEDIHKMHTYPDAIPQARSAWILYPGSEMRLFGREEKNGKPFVSSWHPTATLTLLMNRPMEGINMHYPFVELTPNLTPKPMISDRHHWTHLDKNVPLLFLKNVTFQCPQSFLLPDRNLDRNADNTRQTTTGVDEQDPLHRTWRE